MAADPALLKRIRACPFARGGRVLVRGVRHGSMRQPTAVEITATGDRTNGSDPQQRARGGAGVRPDR
jgi:hypothetical protein